MTEKTSITLREHLEEFYNVHVRAMKDINYTKILVCGTAHESDPLRVFVNSIKIEKNIVFESLKKVKKT